MKYKIHNYGIYSQLDKLMNTTNYECAIFLGRGLRVFYVKQNKNNLLCNPEVVFVLVMVLSNTIIAFKFSFSFLPLVTNAHFQCLEGFFFQKVNSRMGESMQSWNIDVSTGNSFGGVSEEIC